MALHSGSAVLGRFRAGTVQLVYAFSPACPVGKRQLPAAASGLSVEQQRRYEQAHRPPQGVRSGLSGGRRGRPAPVATRGAKANLTAKCLQTLQTPFLALFWLFQSHPLAQHSSLPCHRVAIAAACHGDICQPLLGTNPLMYSQIKACNEIIAARFLSDCWQLPRDVLSDNENYVKLGACSSILLGSASQARGLLRLT
jgi:hypothetical protein